MRQGRSVCLIFAAFLHAVYAVGVDVVVDNGDFEIPTVSGPTIPTSWSCTGAVGSSCAAYYPGYNGLNSAPIPVGNQGGCLQRVGASLSQTLQFPRQGRYRVSFFRTTRNGYGTLPLVISIDGVPVLQLPVPTAAAAPVWTLITREFVVSAGPHQIAFTNAPPTNAPSASTADLWNLIDAVTVSMVAPTSQYLSQALQNAASKTLVTRSFYAAGAICALSASLQQALCWWSAGTAPSGGDAATRSLRDPSFTVGLPAGLPAGRRIVQVHIATDLWLLTDGGDIVVVLEAGGSRTPARAFTPPHATAPPPRTMAVILGGANPFVTLAVHDWAAFDDPAPSYGALGPYRAYTGGGMSAHPSAVFVGSREFCAIRADGETWCARFSLPQGELPPAELLTSGKWFNITASSLLSPSSACGYGSSACASSGGPYTTVRLDAHADRRRADMAVSLATPPAACTVCRGRRINARACDRAQHARSVVHALKYCALPVSPTAPPSSSPSVCSCRTLPSPPLVSSTRMLRTLLT